MMWTKLKAELDRAERVAQSAFDEGRTRLDLFRARQTADRSAQRLGYAVYRARQDGADIAPDQYAALSSDLRAAEAEIARFEVLLSEAIKGRRPDPPPADQSSTQPPTG